MAGSVYRGGTHVWCHLSTLLADPRPVPVQTHCVSDDINGHRRARMETAHRTVSVGATSPVRLRHVRTEDRAGMDGQGSVTSPTRR